MQKGYDNRLNSLEFSLLMFSMTTCLPLFFLGPLAYQMNLSMLQAIVSALIGNGIIGFLMILNGLPGIRERIDYVTHSIKVFGNLYKIPVFLRGIVGGLWYGVEAFNGALALSLILLYTLGYREEILSKALIILPFLLVIYVGSATLVYSKGIVGVGRAASIAGPLLLLYFAYLVLANHTLSLSGSSLEVKGVSWTSTSFLTYLAIQTNWWATVAINISDLSSAARRARDVAIGVIIGLVGGQLLGTVIGYILALRSGSALPHEIIMKGSPNIIILILGLLFAFLAPWTTDLSANIPALEGLIRILTGTVKKRAAIIAGSLGFVLAPWYAMDKAQDIVSYVSSFAASYGVILGPVLGSMLAWLITKRVKGVPAFIGMLTGIVASYLYAFITKNIILINIIGFRIAFPPGITIYLGLLIALIVSLAFSRIPRIG